MSITSEIRLRVKKEGDVALAQLSAKLNDVASRSVISNKKFKDLAATLKANDAQIKGKSINALNDYSRAWRELANSVDVTTKEFKEATAEAARFERQAAKAQGRRGGSSLAGFAKGAGAVAAAGIFGGAEGLVGAGIGAAFGGPTGAAVGGAIGAQVGALRKQAAAIAENIADINKYRIALAGVSKDQKDFSTSIGDTISLSKTFLLPIRDATEQYTKLKASVVGAGYSTKETTEVFKGIASAIIGTGGSTEDLNSALRATAQVFSKGKVSAEELRQQIGERLPGAFTIFADSMGISTQELDKRLEDGEVSLSDFLKFSEELFERYGETAQTIANSPEKAGARLKLALDFATLEFGGFFQKVGAGFQNYARSLVEFALNNEKTIKQVVTILAVGFNEIFGLVTKFAKAIAGVFNSLFTTIFGNLKLVLNRVEEAINRAKAVAALTPEKLDKLKTQAKTETEAKYGLFGTGLIIDQQAAADFYNERFNQLIDAATKAAGATNYTSKIQDLIFPKFTYTGPFGAGIGTGGGIGEEAADGDQKSNERSKQMTKTSQELYELGLLRVEALEREDALNVALLDHQIRLQGIEEMNADANTKNLRIAESRQKFEQDIEKHIENQNNAAVKFETLVGDTLRSTQKLTEEEEKRIKNNQALVPIIEAGMTAIKLGVLSAEELADAIRKIKAAFAGQDGEKSFFEDFKKSFKAGIKDMGDLAGNLGSTLAGAFRGASDVLTDFLTKGTADFKEFARSVLADLANILIQFALFEGLKAITGLSFANGGIMSKDGEVPLKKYAAGGIANSPQLAMFGEGSTPEAYVPLPDGRSIPVTMKGAGSNVQVDSINITVENTGEQLSPAAQKQIANQVQGIVMSTLVNERRSGGVLR